MPPRKLILIRSSDNVVEARSNDTIHVDQRVPFGKPAVLRRCGQIYSDAGRRMAIVDRDVVKDLIKRGCTWGVAQRATGKYYPGSGINDFDELAIEFYKLLNLGPARKLIGGIGCDQSQGVENRAYHDDLHCCLN